MKPEICFYINQKIVYRKLQILMNTQVNQLQKKTNSCKNLRIIRKRNLSWSEHIEIIKTKLQKTLEAHIILNKLFFKGKKIVLNL